MSETNQLSNEVKSMHLLWVHFADNKYRLTNSALKTLQFFLNELDQETVENAMETSFNKIPQNNRIEERFKYFCGVCWCAIKGKGDSNEKQ